MKINSKFKTYSVVFVGNFETIEQLCAQKESYFVIDKIVYDLYKKELPDFPDDRLYLINAIEENKNMETVLDICEKMTVMPSKRNTHLISIGGGIVQDITGFVANALYRGIKWTFYPSTLLAACDSCIGGKSSLNFKTYKNLLGSFYPPDEILIYSNFFKTLSPRDYCSGLGEVVKFNVIAGGNAFDKLENDIDSILNHDYTKLQTYVENSLGFKKKFIEIDEFDRGERILLNFAHTFGHAYESVSSFNIPHGSAVALGMITANNISVERGFIKKEYAKRIENVCWKILTNIEINKKWFSLDNIVKAIRKDKKQTNTDITAVLIKADGNLEIFKDVQIDEIDSAIRFLNK